MQSQKCFKLETGKMDERDFSVQVRNGLLQCEVNRLDFFFLLESDDARWVEDVLFKRLVLFNTPPLGLCGWKKKSSGSQGRSVFSGLISHWGLLALDHH